MKNDLIKITAITPSLRIGDPAYNAKQMSMLAKEHGDAGLIVFPELGISGYTCADLFQSTLLLQECEKGLGMLAKELASLDATVVVGLPVRKGNKLYNCAAVISNGQVKGLVPKSNIPTYSEFYEGRWFASGKDIRSSMVRLLEQDIPFGTGLLFEDVDSTAILGIEICEDLWVPDKPSSHACLAGANIIANLSASDEIIGKQDFRRMMVCQQAAACYCAYVYVSSATNESSTDLVFSGHTVIAENGTQLADSIFPQDNAATSALVDLGKIACNRIRQSTFLDAPEGYQRIPVKMPACGGNEATCEELKQVLDNNDYYIARYPFVPADEEKRAIRCKQILQIQANGLATRVRHTGIKNLIVGISGGLDSTLALIVCNEARKIVPGIRIIGYTMPSRGNTTSLTYDNAIDLMKSLHVEAREVPIEKGVASHLEDIGHGGVYKGEGDTTYENAQARMRTYILMDVANMENGLVVGTGDLSELALGWCTYNGDHMSMYGVNASVPKTLVKYICETYAYTCGDNTLRKTLLSIVDTPISPELTPSKDGQIAQKTEEKIGKYDLNDFFLFYAVRYAFAPAKIISFAMRAYPELDKGFVKDALKRFYKRFFSQQFKRSCLPDGPKVGSVSLSPRGDWRMPSDATCALWLQDIENA